jgi:AcrR family transcriptional regulator
MKTKERIVFGALELFNEQGERLVTTNHIAAHIQISPGNLYYHFRNKQDIVRAIFELYSAELLERFTPPPQNKNGNHLLKQYLDSTFTLMWKYRFFYANLPDILKRDEKLHESYVQVQHKLRHNLMLIIQTLVDLELLVMADDEMSSFITTLHAITISWLGYRSVMSLKATITEDVIHQGMLQIIYVLRPYATSRGLEQLQTLEQGVWAKYSS